jgi:hypothetical protein
MSDETELEIIEFESARNEAVDAYFSARPHLVRDTNSERLVEAGFRMAWYKLKHEKSIKYPTASEEKIISMVDEAIDNMKIKSPVLESVIEASKIYRNENRVKNE